MLFLFCESENSGSKPTTIEELFKVYLASSHLSNLAH